MTPANEPYLINGNLAVDDRGTVSFVNDFTFEGVKRFYKVTNHTAGFIRAWHAHKKEAKYVFISSGAAIVAVVKIDVWDNPSKTLPVHRFIMSDSNPAVLFIPPGYANGFKTLTSNASLVFMSTATLEESRSDDIRYDARLWDPWGVAER